MNIGTLPKKANKKLQKFGLEPRILQWMLSLAKFNYFCTILRMNYKSQSPVPFDNLFSELFVTSRNLKTPQPGWFS